MSTWMLLEDEPDLYDMILAMYEVMGIGGVAFGTGEDAVDWIREVDSGRYTDELPELALLDIRMPDHINGVMVAARLRESAVLNDLVIVMMTAYRMNPDEEKDLIEQAGADFLIYKPLPKLDELHYILNGLLLKKRDDE
jgi:CheY-like chemotaxis protein